MDDLIKSAAYNLDRQILRLAIELEGNEAGARTLIDAMLRSEHHPGVERFLHEAAALLRARKLLGAAMRSPSRPAATRRFEVINGGRYSVSPAA